MPAVMEARYNLKSPGRPQLSRLRPAARREGAGPGWGGRALAQQRAELRPGLSASGGARAGRGASGRAGRAGPGRAAADAGCAGRVGPRCLETLELSLRGTEYLGSLLCLCVSTPFYPFSWLVDA